MNKPKKLSPKKIEVLMRDLYETEQQLKDARAEVERLRNHIHSAETASFVESGALRLSLNQVDAEVDDLRDDLSEAMRLLQAHGEPPAWTYNHGAHFAASWSRRYGELLAKHKETNK